MFTLNNYYLETARRQYEIELANHDRFIRSVSAACESPLARLGIKMLDRVGSKLVEWGSQLQCRCAELTFTTTNRTV